MTRRTEHAGPQTHIAKYVTEAMRIVGARSLPEEQRAVLSIAVGSPKWRLLDGEREIASGQSSELETRARVLTRACIARLCVGDQSDLSRNMRDASPVPGAVPPFFHVTLSVTGSSWALRVAAHYSGTGATIAEVEGTLIEAEQCAA
jgi:hypothetical protein